MNLPFQRHGGGEPGSEHDARPIVAVRRHDRTGWWFAGGAGIAAVLLFATLEARRQGVEQASAPAASSELGTPQAVPDLVMPIMPAEPGAVPMQGWLQPGDVRQQRESPLPANVARPSNPGPAYAPPQYASPSIPPPLPVDAMQGAAGAQPPPGPSYDQQPQSSTASRAVDRSIQAGRLANPASTVIQGTLINAVLETAIDSTSPGQTRAIVTRNVYGFDGTRILIPRGTRLYGTYESNVALGQKRAQIRWTRLLTPNGVTVALDSPAADPLGRAGVQAKVNNHFIQRLGNAILGTASAVGSSLMTSNMGNSPVVVAVPGAAQAATQVAPSSNQITPTLTVRQGTRISVFVQHDLDFSSVDEALQDR